MAAGLRRRQFQHRKRLQNKSCFDCLCFSAHSSQARPGQNPELSFLSRCLCMWRPKCPMHSACGSVRGEKSAGEGKKRGCFLRTHHSGTEWVRVPHGSDAQTQAGPPAAATTSPGSFTLRLWFLKHSSKFPPV